MTSKEQISHWFEHGVFKGARHLLIVCDTFSYDDYPVFTNTDSECLAKYKYPGDMQRVMEVYDLTADKDAQLKLDRAFSLPSSD